MAHSDCGWTCGCAGKTVKSLENTCHTWALLQQWFTTKRRYIKCMHLYLFTFTFTWLVKWSAILRGRLGVSMQAALYVVCQLRRLVDESRPVDDILYPSTSRSSSTWVRINNNLENPTVIFRSLYNFYRASLTTEAVYSRIEHFLLLGHFCPTLTRLTPPYLAWIRSKHGDWVHFFLDFDISCEFQNDDAFFFLPSDSSHDTWHVCE